MEVILSLLPSTSGAVQGIQAAGGTLSSTSVPSVLANLPAGTLVRGFVLTRDNRGNPILRTDRGDFLLQSPFFLKIGSDVVLKLEHAGQQTRANLLSVDGLPPGRAENVPAHATDEDVVQQPGAGRNTPAAGARGTARSQPAAAETAAVRTPATPAKPGGVLEGTLLRPAASAGEGRATPAAGRPAETAAVLFRIVDLTPPARPFPGAPAASPPGLRDAAVASAENKTPEGVARIISTPHTAARISVPAPAAGTAPQQSAPQAQAAPPLPPAQGYSTYARAGSQAAPAEALLPALMQRPATGGAATQQMSLPLEGGGRTPGNATVNATVVQTSAAGEPILETPLGLLRLHSAVPLPPGTALKLEVLNLSPAVPAAGPAPAAAPPTLPALAAQWTTLQEILQWLRAADPHSAGQLARQLSPGPLPTPSQPFTFPTLQGLSASLYFFLNALKSGDFRSFIGAQAARALEAHGKAGLLRAAEAEFATLRHYFAELPPQQWQALFLPVLVENETRMLRFYVKRDRKSKSGRDRSAAADTRFVVEMELSALGAMQLDGLVRKQEKQGTQFDLIIRSRAWLDDEVQQDIRRIYTVVGEATGYQGLLMFQLVDDFPVRPLDEILAETGRQVTV